MLCTLMNRAPEALGGPAAVGRSRASGLLALVALVALVARPAAAVLPDHPAVYEAAPASWVVPVPAPVGESVPGAVGDASGGTEVDELEATGAALAFRVVDDQVRVAGDRSAVYSDRVVEVLSQQGLGEAAEWTVLFDPGYQRVRVHRLAVERDGDWQDRLVTARGSVLQRESDLGLQIYDESRTLLLVLEDVRVGDRVRFAYTVEGFNPVLGDRFAGSYRLGWSAPVDRLRLRLLAPPGEPLYYRVHASPGEAGGALDEPEEGTAADGGREIVWWRSGVPAIDLEHGAPATWVQLPFVQVSQFAAWPEVVAWGRKLYPREPVPAELREVARSIAAAHPGDPGARLIAASRWVQDELRYFAVTLGPHSHTPHRVADVLRRRYGDCKDKTRTLIELLGELGIDAWPAFVGSVPGDLTTWHPSPFAFDHVVVVARPGTEGAGTEGAGAGPATVWVDATLELQGGRLDSLYFPAFDAALEIRPGVEALTPRPSEQTEPGTTDVRYEYRMLEWGEPFEVTVETVYERSGAESMRRTLASTTLADLQDRYVDFYADGARTVEPLAELAVDDRRDDNRITVTERYRVSGCWQETDHGSECYLLPLLMESQLPDPGPAERRAPFGLPRDYAVHETVRIRTAGWDLGTVNEQVESSWFRFSASSIAQPGGLELAYDLRTLVPWVDAAEVGAYGEEVRRMNEALGYGFMQEEPARKELVERPAAILALAILLVMAAIWSLLMLVGGAGLHAWWSRSDRAARR